jgi:hypothetical protein
MLSTYLLLPTFLVLLFSFLVVRAGAVALMLTGVEPAKARFQSLSAFSGTGFTTREAESVINDPTRRRIITWLIVIGNIGIVTVIVTATSSIVSSQGREIPLNVVLLVGGVTVLFWLASRKGVIKRWDAFIEKRLLKSRTLEESSAEDLLHFLEGYGLLRGTVRSNSPLVGSTLQGLRLAERGILVLGIERGERWIPIPRASEAIELGDRVIVYGPMVTLRSVLGSGGSGLDQTTTAEADASAVQGAGDAAVQEPAGASGEGESAEAEEQAGSDTPADRSEGGE